MEKDRKGLCIGSMIIGIISILMFVIQPIVFIASVVGIIIGIVGLRASYDGKNMAIAGIVMSSIGAIAGILIMGSAIRNAVFIDKNVGQPGNNGHYFYYENDDNNFHKSFEFHIDGGPKGDFKKEPEERPDMDDFLL